MPRARRRRLNRLRKRPVDHNWVTRSNVSVSRKKLIIPINGVINQFNIKFDFFLVNSLDDGTPDLNISMNLRICSKCGQESVNYKLPKFSCKEYLVFQIMSQ